MTTHRATVDQFLAGQTVESKQTLIAYGPHLCSASRPDSALISHRQAGPETLQDLSRVWTPQDLSRVRTLQDSIKRHALAPRFSPVKRAGAALGVVILVAVAGCSQDSKSAADTMASSVEAQFSAETTAAAAAETAAAEALVEPQTKAVANEAVQLDGSGGAQPPAGSAIPVTPQTGAQIKRAELTVQLTSAQFRSGVAQATQLPGSVGGFVQSSQVSGGAPIDDKRNEPRFAVVVMRVPSARFDDVADGLAA